MQGPESLGHFFGNLVRLMGVARMTPRQVSRAMGRAPDHVAEMIRQRTAPDLEGVYAIAGALRVDVADLLRPGPAPGAKAESARDRWAEKVAESVLAGALEDSRHEAAAGAPTIDAVLTWWHANDGLLAEMDGIEQHVEIFDLPSADMRPVPRRLGRQGMAARELNLSTVEQLDGILRKADPAVVRAIALAHASVVEGEPKLSLQSILIDMSDGRLVKIGYFRLLLPVHDIDGRRYVLSYAKPVRRHEIGAERAGGFEPVNRRQPVLSALA